ncbi:hypothetical protein EDC04DRAFT_2599619 [Pisolithus marmoratus]|nr:hypothetical protein EDC04DRAFT_2599619 [Pisolithus marmoratus]
MPQPPNMQAKMVSPDLLALSRAVKFWSNWHLGATTNKLKSQHVVQPPEGWEEHMFGLRDRRHSLTLHHQEGQVYDEDTEMDEMEEDMNVNMDELKSSSEQDKEKPVPRRMTGAPIIMRVRTAATMTILFVYFNFGVQHPSSQEIIGLMMVLVYSSPSSGKHVLASLLNIILIALIMSMSLSLASPQELNLRLTHDSLRGNNWTSHPPL